MEHETGYFTQDTFDFLFDLDIHNERAWFEANRDRFEAHVKEPMLAFIADLAEPLTSRVSPHLRVVPKMQGGSMFRIHRDARFTTGDRPFKSNAGAQFRHEAASRDVHAPGLYLHLEPGNCYMGGGVYRPPTKVLTPMRQRIVDDPGVWTRTRNAVSAAGFTLGGDQLRTHPRGFDPEHPHIEDLRRTSLVVSRTFDERDACAPEFLQTYVGWCEDATPLLGWICRSLDVPF